MDPKVVEELRRLGLALGDDGPLPHVAVLVVAGQVLAPVGPEVPVAVHGRPVLMRLRPLTGLCVRGRPAPSFRAGPTREHARLFAALEGSVAACTDALPGLLDHDAARAYRRLRRQPDHLVLGDPLFAYVQASARLYVSLVDTSWPELDAALAHLAREASGPGAHEGSRRYLDRVRELYLGVSPAVRPGARDGRPAPRP